jgi:hypothetical protein
LLKKGEKLSFFLNKHLANHIALTIRDIAIGEKLLVQGNVFFADKYVVGDHNASLPASVSDQSIRKNSVLHATSALTREEMILAQESLF